MCEQEKERLVAKKQEAINEIEKLKEAFQRAVGAVAVIDELIADCDKHDCNKEIPVES